LPVGIVFAALVLPLAGLLEPRRVLARPELVEWAAFVLRVAGLFLLFRLVAGFDLRGGMGLSDSLSARSMWLTPDTRKCRRVVGRTTRV
jgi:hypothetical protein